MPLPQVAAIAKAQASTHEQLTKDRAQLAEENWHLGMPGTKPSKFESTNFLVLGNVGENTLADIAKVLLSVGIDHLTVEGHADNSGSPEHNQSLSERRANVVATTLSTYGFALANIKCRGYGASRPFASNDTAAGRAQNRRAVLIVPSH